MTDIDLVVTDGTPLTRKQYDFAWNYYLTGDAVKSALMAGYVKESAKKAGKRLVSHPKVMKQLHEFKVGRIKAVEDVTDNDIRDELWRLSKCVSKDSDKIRCLELLGKTIGMFKDNTTNNVALFDMGSMMKKLEKIKGRNIKPLSVEETIELDLENGEAFDVVTGDGVG